MMFINISDHLQKVLIRKVNAAVLILLFSLILFGCSGDSHDNANNKASTTFEADLEVELRAVPAKMQILKGKKTEVYTYKAKVLKGNPNQVVKFPNSYLGPAFYVQQGQKLRIRFKNELTKESIIHWHGLHLPASMDGHPINAVEKGEQYVYEFEVVDRPGTYWFHPHPDQITGPQVYRGLAGLFIIERKNEPVPTGEYNLPLIIQDRSLNNENQLVYLSDHPMKQMQGFLGEKILVNGSVEKKTRVEKATYRLRLLNGSNSRIYKIAWSDKHPLIVTGTDGGLLSHPVKMPYIMLAPGERTEIWKDFSESEEGKEIRLKSLEFEAASGMGHGMSAGGGMMRNQMQERMMENRDAPGSKTTVNGAPFDIYTFVIGSEEGRVMELPDSFAETESIDPQEAANYGNPREFHFFNDHMQWVINGKTFEMDEVADWEIVKLNTTEIWKFINGTSEPGRGMMENMMQMPHPVHIHGLQFQILNRDISGMDPQSWETIKQGFVDKGWQDTFLLMPGMKVQVIMRFKDFTGMYVYHCHNLEHEDNGMMRNYKIIK